MVSQVDLLASLAALTGAAIPEGRAGDSRNLIEVLTGKSDQGRTHLVQQGASIRSIRAGDWKYFPEGSVSDRTTIGKYYRERITKPGALYYLPEDPEERSNLAFRYPGKVRELRALLQQELGDVPLVQEGTGNFGGAVDK